MLAVSVINIGSNKVSAYRRTSGCFYNGFAFYVSSESYRESFN